ncbi:MAG: hypothetical protein IJW59_01340 [Clostridia bacterium]|nr:hypothetical protein [Clostridia bacterium]
MGNKNFKNEVVKKIEEGATSFLDAMRGALNDMTSSATETLKTVVGVHSLSNADERARRQHMEDLLMPLKMSPERGIRTLESEVFALGGTREQDILDLARKNRNYYNTLQSEYIKLVGLDNVIEATEVCNDGREYSYENVLARLRSNRGIALYEDLIKKGYTVSNIAELVENGVRTGAGKPEVYRMQDLTEYCERTGISELTK